MAKHVNTTGNIQAPQTPEDEVAKALGLELSGGDSAPEQAPAAAEAPKKKAKKEKANVPATTGVNGSLHLTEDEMVRLEEEARKEVEEELKANLAKEYKENFKANLKRKALFRDAENEEGDGMIDILIDLPPFCPDIRIDGVSYLPGQTYRVGKAKAATLVDVMARAYRHDDETSGADANKLAYRRQRRDRVKMQA